MKGPRVLVVGPRLDVGGTETHLLRVLPRLRAAGVDLSLFTIEQGGSMQPAFEAAGVPVSGARAQGGRLARNVRAAWQLRSEIKRLRPDIVHFFLAEPYLVGSFAAVGFAGVKRVMSRRSLAHYQQRHPSVGYLERALHRSTSALIGNSSAVCRELVQESAAPKKVGLIHNGIDVAPISSRERQIASRRNLGIPEGAFVVVVVANLISYKGHADLIAALAGVRDRLGPDWRLLLAGRDDGIGAALRAQAEAAGIARHVCWLGECKDVNGMLAAADVGVLPSHEEGFSNSLIEMMALALPVIATSVGGNTDAVEDGISGLLVPARDPAALAEAILKLSADPGLRRRVGQHARTRVERLFSIGLCTQRYLNLYSGLMRGSGPVSELIAGCDIASAMRAEPVA